MRIYTVYSRAGCPPDLVAEAFSWPAALFQPAWALWRGGWRAAACLLIGGLTLPLARAFDLPAETAAGLTLVMAVAAGLFGPDLLRWDLARRGYRPVALVAGSDTDAARLHYHATGTGHEASGQETSGEASGPAS